MRFMAGFVLGIVAGYCTVLFGWVAYTNLVHVRDFEGAASMGVASFYAPLGGLLTGGALGIWWQMRNR